MHIRIATSLDRDDVRGVHLAAFAEDEREIVSKLAVNLLSEETTPQTISLVAETEGAVVGHVGFSPVTIGTNENYQSFILGGRLRSEDGAKLLPVLHTVQPLHCIQHFYK